MKSSVFIAASAAVILLLGLVQIRGEMLESLTAMLLSCDLAMSVPGVPAPAVEKVRTIDTLVRDMRVRPGVN